ncbi:hypothetical protein [Pseudomonas chlororaphis]|jgi:hypothetical protein|uniref:hypothetical protein n=1 Tax=Pseudomonas chlororaphis TaxID=587753 RepID=UPI0015DF6BEF|nr:hypothetical protein [Pseudomonas chlororaphis]QLL12571.1 hypothetical protein H0I86_26865 [Pseudomonas chlororaphis subsp. aurantiaca]
MALMIDVEPLIPLTQAKKMAMQGWFEAVDVHVGLAKGSPQEHQACLSVMAAQQRHDELARALATAVSELIERSG